MLRGADRRCFSVQNKSIFSAALNAEVQARTWIQANNPKPKKWMGRVQELNQKILQHQLAYTKAKYDAARLTTRTHKRTLFLLKELQAKLYWRNGAILCITEADPVMAEHGRAVIADSDSFASKAREYEGYKAVENMLKGKYDKKTK